MARNIARYTPRNEMARLMPFSDFGNLLRGLSLAPVLRELEQAPRMKVDIEETDQAYILRADVPGANKEDITVTVDGDTVTIATNVEQQRTHPNSSMLSAERVYGEEYRVFSLPQQVDEAKADARIENGVLMLTLPKKTGAGAKKLDIREEAAGGAGGAGGTTQSAAGSSQQAQPAAGSAQDQSGGGAKKSQSS